MNKIFCIKFLALFFLLLGSTNLSHAYTCPKFEFKKDMVKGVVSEDVRVLQEILNTDKRTVVSQTGLGSKGNETALFGVATRESLKRFQALFIEYIGVADGKFNQKTRTVMNRVCQGPFFTGNGKNPYDLATSTAPTDKIAPIIGIGGPASSTIDTTFRVYIAANEAIRTPTLEGLMIFNATAGDVRKTSSTTFTFLVTPNLDATEKITLQFEADVIEDLAGNKNEVASNEWVVTLSGTPLSTTTRPVDTSLLDDILNNLPTASSTNVDCSVVTSVSVYDYSNPCYGRAPTTGGESGGGEGGGGGGMEQIMQMLQGLLKGLTGLGGGGGGEDAGGTGVPSGVCMCPPLKGQPTGVLAGLKGPSGGTLLTPCPGAGRYVGKAFPPPPICGQAFIKGKCINPQSDSNGVPLTSTVGACGPTWQWNN